MFARRVDGRHPDERCREIDDFFTTRLDGCEDPIGR
jgi:hypothetical protein